MAAILTVQGGIIMQNRQISPRGVYLALLAAAAVLCLTAGLAWLVRGQPQAAPPRYLLRDCAGHPALYTAEGTGPLATYEEIYTHLLPESDVLALQQGVYLANEAELQQRLEDYGHLSRVNAQKSKNIFYEARMRAISSRKSCSEHR